MARQSKKPPFPSRDAILEFLRTSTGRIGKRDIARAFGIAGPDREILKSLLKDLEKDGAVERSRGRRLALPGALPEIVTVEITGLDRDGEPEARPVDWSGAQAPPRIKLSINPREKNAPGIGERAVARVRRIGPTLYEGKVLKRLDPNSERLLGVYFVGPSGGRLRPTDRRMRTEFAVSAEHAGTARNGDIVSAEILPARRSGLPCARILEKIGDAGDARSASVIALHTRGIPIEFSADAIRQSRNAHPPSLAGRVDLRDMPLVTIDDQDARDFDDAVWAEPDSDPNNLGGFRLAVAIADVGHYVRPGDALDRSARERGNSVYLPDRVVPMLPEGLSNDLCSLRPGEDRACLVAHMCIDGEGRKLRHRFERALMRSAARLTYAAVEETRQGGRSDIPAGIVEPLYAAFAALRRARDRRGTLDLEIEERRVILREDGQVERIEPRPHFDSHRLIEEFMIAANVAAAEAIEERRLPCMYRVHERPDPEKVDNLREVLAGLGFRLAKGQVMRPSHFNGALAWANDTPHLRLVNDLVLRSQAQAVYSLENKGHFGLALIRYAHFTSPIRRYSDILVHRALITGLDLGEGGLFAEGPIDMEAVADHISGTERRAAAAERDAVNRYVTAFLAQRVGATFPARISGVSRFGLFVSLDGLGADGLVPIRSLPADSYRHDAARHRLEAQGSKRYYSLGDVVDVRLDEADPVTGSLILHLISETAGRSASRSVRAPIRKRRR